MEEFAAVGASRRPQQPLQAEVGLLLWTDVAPRPPPQVPGRPWDWEERGQQTLETFRLPGPLESPQSLLFLVGHQCEGELALARGMEGPCCCVWGDKEC